PRLVHKDTPVRPQTVHSFVHRLWVAVVDRARAGDLAFFAYAAPGLRNARPLGGGEGERPGRRDRCLRVSVRSAPGERGGPAFPLRPYALAGVLAGHRDRLG